MDIDSKVKKKIDQGYEILDKLSRINIDGASKLKNKIKQEINFLEKCLKMSTVKEEHLVCSNLIQLEALAFKLLKHQNICTGVMTNKTLTFEDGCSRKICIDLILHGGSVWMKVIARNQKAITAISNGEGTFKQKSILDQALEFVECSKQNIHFYKPPSIIFFFANGIENCVAKDLKEIGVEVESNNVMSHLIDNINITEDTTDVTDYPIKDLKLVRNLAVIQKMPHMKLNLGVTTLIAYVSALTNGGCHYNFKSEILQKHAQWERARPVKPILDSLFEGRELYCCTSAANIFKGILNTLGGETEKKRGENILKRVTVVDDKPTDKLKPFGKLKRLKERSLAIFGTGEHLRAVTVTANHAFVRSAMNQGVYFSVFLHESRALTEGKQLTANG